MLLADAGASVLRLDRPQTQTDGGAIPTPDMLARYKASIAVDLKDARSVALIKDLAKKADVLIDPFRPGVLERLGLGPEELMAANPRLVYARMTGFRRDGRYAAMAGHDINYLAVSGVLGLLGREGEKPHAPCNILADFAGGGAMLVHGILLALLARGSSGSGKGQVVEANMVDGSSYLASFPRMSLKTPLGDRGRGRNILDGGCPWYDTYETADGKYMSVGALEPQFFAALLTGLGLQDSSQRWEECRWDDERWPELRKLFADTFKAHTRTHWEAVFDGTDACCTPVLEYVELEGRGASSPSSSSREGDQRPAVTLRATPCLAIDGEAPRDGGNTAVYGQGGGVPGGGYEGHNIAVGEGGEEMLADWTGWRKGVDYDAGKGGALISKNKAVSKL